MPKKYLFIYALGAILVATGLWLTTSDFSSKKKVPTAGTQALFDNQRDGTSQIKPLQKHTQRTLSSKHSKKPHARLEDLAKLKDQQRAKKDYLNTVGPYLESAGKTFQVGKEQYKILPDLLAIPKNVFPPSDGHRYVLERIGHVFFHPNSKAKIPSTALAVAMNEKNQMLAIVTGRLKVRMLSQTTPESLVKDYGIEFVRSFDHLNLAYFDGAKSSSQELVQLADTIRKDKRVERVDIELIEKIYVSR